MLDSYQITWNRRRFTTFCLTLTFSRCYPTFMSLFLDMAIEYILKTCFRQYMCVKIFCINTLVRNNNVSPKMNDTSL